VVSKKAERGGRKDSGFFKPSDYLEAIGRGGEEKSVAKACIKNGKKGEKKKRQYC